MLSAGTYVKILLKKRNMTQAQLLKRMNELKLGPNGKELNKSHLNNFINGTGTTGYIWARRIEIAMELPEGSLIKMIGNPTKGEWVRIKGVKPNV